MARFLAVAIVALSSCAMVLAEIEGGVPSNCSVIYKKFVQEFNATDSLDHLNTTDEHVVAQTNVVTHAVNAHLLDKKTDTDTTYSLNENCHMSVDEMRKFFANHVPEVKADPVQNPNETQFVHPASRAYARQVSTNADSTIVPWLKYDGVIVDWRPVMVDIKNQLKCGSCYAFATMAQIEARAALSAGKTKAVAMSEQQVVDCSYVAKPNPGNHGCNGGNAGSTFDYFTQVGKYNLMADYPYISGQGTCNLNSAKAKPITLAATGCRQKSVYNNVAITIKDIEDALQGGPVNAAIDVEDDFFLYSGGMYKPVTCKADSTSSDCNHAVTIVGYGKNAKDGDYWIVRNSWGCSWGEAGYFRIAKGKNVCGIETDIEWTIIKT